MISLVEMEIPSACKNLKVLSKEKYGSMYLDGDSLYYSSWWQLPNEKGTYAANGPVYRVRLTGGTPQKITEGYSRLIAAEQGWIYTIVGRVLEPSTLTRFKPMSPSKKEVIIPLKKDTYFHLSQIIVAYGIPRRKPLNEQAFDFSLTSQA